LGRDLAYRMALWVVSMHVSMVVMCIIIVQIIIILILILVFVFVAKSDQVLTTRTSFYSLSFYYHKSINRNKKGRLRAPAPSLKNIFQRKTFL
jgi:uncharacterized membrane protein YqiK